MSNVQQNIKQAKEIIEQVKRHCMCAKFKETPTHFIVYYPNGMYPDGAQASKVMGKALAASRLIEVMERHWKENGI